MVVEICFFWVVNELNMYFTVSFYSIFLVLFSICSAIATLRVCMKFQKAARSGCGDMLFLGSK